MRKIRWMLTFLLLFCLIHFSWQENPNIANESAHAQAREALKKYLHYFERVRKICWRWSQCCSISFSLVGKSLEEHQARGCDFRNYQKQNHGGIFLILFINKSPPYLYSFRRRWMPLREPGSTGNTSSMLPNSWLSAGWLYITTPAALSANNIKGRTLLDWYCTCDASNETSSDTRFSTHIPTPTT